MLYTALGGIKGATFCSALQLSHRFKMLSWSYNGGFFGNYLCVGKMVASIAQGQALCSIGKAATSVLPPLTTLSLFSKMIPAKYCFTKYANSDTLKVCSNYQLQTVRPTILTGNYPLTKIKNNLTNGAIISFDMTSIVRKELSVSINYIRQKGYDFLTLSELLSEEMK